MRYRHYHVVLDPAPQWGAVSGFGWDRVEYEWQQPASWWQIMLVHFSGVYTVNGVPVPFPAHSMLVAPAGARCSIERTDSDNISQFWVKFNPAAAGDMVMALPQVHPLGTEFDYYDSMFRKSLDLLPLSKGMVNSLALTLLWSAAQVAAGTPEDPALAAAEALMRANLSADVTVDQLARDVDVSPAKLYGLFREHHGQTPSEHLRMLRMQYACALLTRTDLPIKEIAAKTGYPNLQRFNKVVRETFGCAPRALRHDQPTIGMNVDSKREEYQELAARQADKPRV